MVNIGVLGYGYWGPNIVRNFSSVEEANVASICDINTLSLGRARRTFPGIPTTTSYSEITKSPSIDAVAIVTPVSTHYELARDALENGKHIFVEKPFTATVAQAEELIELAERKKLKIMVDHTFLFTGAVRKIKELIETDTMGDLLYYDSTRVNLGLFQHDVNVIWDLTPHDLSIMDYIIDEKPEAITANGKPHFNESLADVAYLTVYFGNNMIAHFNANWLSPVKVRTTLIGGQKRMLVWNDLDSDEKIKVYDKGVKIQSSEGIYKLLVSYRSGDMWSPKIDQTEALKAEAEYFVGCVMNGEMPFNDGVAGLRVVKMLVASNESLNNNGRMVMLNSV